MFNLYLFKLYKFLGAKVGGFWHSHNPTCVAFHIPHLWYIEENGPFLGENLVFCLLIRTFAGNYDSMHCRETQCGERHCPHYRRNGLTRWVYGRKRIPGDMDLRTPVYTEGAWRLHPSVEALGSDAVAHGTTALRY